jgi:uncharacterized protein YecE (DUF72 family)
MPLSLGCAIWSHPGWLGDFFPAKSKPADFLSLYAERLTAVEGNTTFYAVPSPETAARWAEEVPPSFRFCLKLHRDLTHGAGLSTTDEGVRRFLDQTAPLHEKRGPIFAQLPPHFSPAQVRELESFLQRWPFAESPLAVEVRHPGWFVPKMHERLRALLEDHGAGLAMLDSRPVYSAPLPGDLACKKPKLPLLAARTAPFAMLRLVGHPDPARTEPFLVEWSERLAAWLAEETELFVFMHCPAEERTPGYARRLHELLRERGAPVAPLPWESVKPRGQLALF